MSSDDKSWVFDSLVGFLKGPMWNGPILSFIEQKSIFFEAGEKITEDHIKLHNEYKNLVDYMLGTYMEEMGITPTDFENACSEPSREIEAKLHQTLFEQVWAANDMEIFHRMMIEKNLDLQLQALEMIHHRFGITPQSFVLNFSPKKIKYEIPIEKQIVQMSLEHADAETDTFLERLSGQEDETVTEEEDSRKEEKPLASLSAIEKISQLEAESSSSDYKLELKETAVEAKTKDVDEEEILRRKEYLRSQRDKLVEMKRRERENSLRSAYEGDFMDTPRPKTAEAAESIMSGNFEINPKTLELRKALAKRLKEEKEEDDDEGNKITNLASIKKTALKATELSNYPLPQLLWGVKKKRQATAEER